MVRKCFRRKSNFFCHRATAYPPAAPTIVRKASCIDRGIGVVDFILRHRNSFLLITGLGSSPPPPPSSCGDSGSRCGRGCWPPRGGGSQPRPRRPRPQQGRPPLPLATTLDENVSSPVAVNSTCLIASFPLQSPLPICHCLRSSSPLFPILPHTIKLDPGAVAGGEPHPPTPAEERAGVQQH